MTAATDDPAARRLAVLVYALQALSLLVGFTILVGAVINYTRLDAVRGTVWESHFRWQLRSFHGLAACAVVALVLFGIGEAAAATPPLLVGQAIVLGAIFWFVYRLARGWLALGDGRTAGGTAGAE